MKAINQSGCILNMSGYDYRRLISRGIKLTPLNRADINQSDNIIYTASSDDYPIRRKDIKSFGNENIFQRGVMEAKRYKILPHLFFPNKEITIWIDSNIYLKISSQEAIDRFLGDADIAIFKHPYRSTIWEEFNTLMNDERFKKETWMQSQMKEQEEFYRKEGMPEDTGLWECNFIIARNIPKVNRFMETWWAEICRWQWRDQLSFPYVLWKHGKNINLKTIEEGNIRTHKLFKYTNHYGK